MTILIFLIIFTAVIFTSCNHSKSQGAMLEEIFQKNFAAKKFVLTLK